MDLLEQKMRALKQQVQQQKDTIMDETNEHNRTVAVLTDERDSLRNKSQFLEETLIKYVCSRFREACTLLFRT